jgi:hypothetical protein
MASRALVTRFTMAFSVFRGSQLTSPPCEVSRMIIVMALPTVAASSGSSDLTTTSMTVGLAKALRSFTQDARSRTCAMRLVGRGRSDLQAVEVLDARADPALQKVQHADDSLQRTVEVVNDGACEAIHGIRIGCHRPLRQQRRHGQIDDGRRHVANLNRSA